MFFGFKIILFNGDLAHSVAEGGGTAATRRKASLRGRVIVVSSLNFDSEDSTTFRRMLKRSIYAGASCIDLTFSVTVILGTDAPIPPTFIASYGLGSFFLSALAIVITVGGQRQARLAFYSAVIALVTLELKVDSTRLWQELKRQKWQVFAIACPSRRCPFLWAVFSEWLVILCRVQVHGNIAHASSTRQP